MMAIAPHLQMVMAPVATPRICHLLPLLSSPSLLCAFVAIVLRPHPHHMAETWAIEALIQTAVPHHKLNRAAGQAMPHGNVWPVSAYMTVHHLLQAEAAVVTAVAIAGA